MSMRFNKVFGRVFVSMSIVLIFMALGGCAERSGEKNSGHDETETLPVLADSLREKAVNLLERDPSISAYYEFDKRGIIVKNVQDSSSDEEIVIFWEEVSAIRNAIKSLDPRAFDHFIQEKGVQKLDSRAISALPVAQKPFVTKEGAELPLNGLKVALDPGHFGGSMEFAEFEKKYVRIRGRKLKGVRGQIAFNEGNRALETALLLKARLENLGAEVMLTRDAYGKGAFGKTFDEWLLDGLEEDLERFSIRQQMDGAKLKEWRANATDKDLFRKLFRRFDFEERARKINAFKPHISLIIHYNIEEKNEPDKGGFLKPQDKNYSMVFVPGAFMKGELDSSLYRSDFVRLLLGDGIEGSIDFSAVVQEAFEQDLGVPAVRQEKGLRYLEKASLRAKFPGIYARNLSMTRMTGGVMAFGEALLQDNTEECIRLNTVDYQEDTIRTSGRVLETTQAYYNAILRYYGLNPQNYPYTPKPVIRIKEIKRSKKMKVPVPKRKSISTDTLTPATTSKKDKDPPKKK